MDAARQLGLAKSDSLRARRSEAREGFSNGCTTSNELLNCVEPGTHVKRYLVRPLQGVEACSCGRYHWCSPVHRPRPAMVVSEVNLLPHTARVFPLLS